MNRARFALTLLTATAAFGVLATAPQGQAACCYFSALGSDVTQPAQKAFLTWDPTTRMVSFTVQPKFEGDAGDFGMVIPTPNRPRLNEMPRAFFKELATFTILKPMPQGKYKPGVVSSGGFAMFGGGMMGGMGGSAGRESTVRVLEAGVVGSLDYKIVAAERADDLYDWLKENRYTYDGDEEMLKSYLSRRWFFTVMRIDPRQMKRSANGKYTGEVTPTRFTFRYRTLVYPLRITVPSVENSTDALFYIHAPTKMDLPGRFSYQFQWTPTYRKALSLAIPERMTEAEHLWNEAAEKELPELTKRQDAVRKEDPHWTATRLEWAGKLTPNDLAVFNDPRRFGRSADPEAILNLRLLRGHLQPDQWLTKMSRTFRPSEMTEDLEFVEARVGESADESEYTHLLPAGLAPP